MLNRILIVEDQKTLGLPLVWTLEKQGYETCLVNSGEAAWDVLECADWRLIITDWIMPEMDGLELCRRIRARQGKSYCYIIMLTGLRGREYRLEGLDAGADDFLSKPVDEDELVVRLTIARRILSMQSQLEQSNARLDDLAHTDPLTGLANRRRLDGAFASSLSCVRGGEASSVIALDIDHFKSYNDTYGHAAGDGVLCTVAGLLKQCVRPNDLVVRTGGEEFTIVLPGTGKEEALTLADRLRQTIAAHLWPLRLVTASFGVATATAFDEPSCAATFLEDADRALYHSKQSGRNRVTHFSHLTGRPVQPRLLGKPPRVFGLVAPKGRTAYR